MKTAGKRKKGIAKRIRRGIFVVLFIYILAAIIPYYFHPEVSAENKEWLDSIEVYSDATGPERLAYITDNADALLYRLKMIEEAEKEIIVSTFDFNDDESGQDMLAALFHAAERGVSVRLIVDGFSGFLDMRNNNHFQALASSPNAEIKIYNPINFAKPWKMMARLHDKYVIIDHKMYLLGGRNTINLFLGDYSDAKNIDRELFVYETGNAANTSVSDTSAANTSLFQLRQYFESVWELADSVSYGKDKATTAIETGRNDLEERYPLLRENYKEAYKSWDWEDLTIKTNKITLLHNPIEAENKEPWMWYKLCKLMEQGTDIFIYTPYVICGNEMYQDLSRICEDTETVEILINDVAKGANPWGCTDYLNQKEKIWATGVKVYEYMGAHSCHTKSLVIDERLSIVGSYNIDMKSTYQDTELMLVVDCKELNQMIRKEAEEDKTYSKTMLENGSY